MSVARPILRLRDAVVPRPIPAAAVSAVVCLLVASTAFAQGFGQFGGPTDPTTAGRPYRGLFGGRPPDPNATQTLTFTAALNGSYQQNTLPNFAAATTPMVPDDTTSVDPVLTNTSTFGSLDFSASYGKRFPFATWNLSGSGHVFYNQKRASPFTASYGVGTGLGGNLGARTRYGINGNLNYSPYYVRGPLGRLGGTELINAIDPTNALFSSRNYTTIGNANVGYSLTQLSNINADYALRSHKFVGGSVHSDLTEQRAGLSYSRNFTRIVGVHAGYAFSRAHYGLAIASTTPTTPATGTGGSTDPVTGTTTQPTPRPDTQFHSIDIGLDLSRAYSLTKRTFFSFNTGSSLIGRDRTTRGRNQRGYIVLATGNATLSHDIGRSWIARLQYSRNVRFVDAFTVPFLTDSLQASVTGYFGTRLDLNGAFRYAKADAGISGRRNYTDRQGSIRLQYALSRTAAAYVQGLYSYYRFNSGVQLPPGFLSHFERVGVRVGMNFWFSVLP